MSSIKNDVKQLRQLILDSAMRGRLVPQDPNDEPASILLEKIKDIKSKLVVEGKIKVDKHLTEIKIDKIPFKIPSNWEWVCLGSIYNIGSSKRVYESEWKIEGVPFYRAREIVKLSKYGCVDNDLFISKELYREYSLKYGNPKENDLMVTGVGTLGVCYMVQNKDEFYFKDGNVVWFKHFTDLVDSRYIKYLFNSSVIINQINSHSAGSTVGTYTISNAKRTAIPFPPISEQLRIVQKIDGLMKLCDDIEQRSISLEDKLKDLKSAILQSAIQGKLVSQDPNDEPADALFEKLQAEKIKLIKEGKVKKEKPIPEIKSEKVPFEIPSSWKWVRLNEVFDVRDGTHNTPVYVETGFPLITSKNLINGELSFDTCKNISEKDYNQIIERSEVDIGDILFAMIGTIGNPAIVKTNKKFAIKNVGLFKKILDEPVLNKYLYYYLLIQTEEMKRISAGGVQAFVSLGFLRNYAFSLPPLQEQRRIVHKIDKLIKFCDEIEQRVNLIGKLPPKVLDNV